MRVPHAQFVEAITPLLALCGQEPMSIFTDLHITNAAPDALLRIEMVSTVDPDDGTEPIVVGDDPATSMHGWPVTVEVI